MSIMISIIIEIIIVVYIKKLRITKKIGEYTNNMFDQNNIFNIYFYLITTLLMDNKI